MAQACPSREVLKHVTSRWGVLVLIALEGKTRRFSELRRSIGGVSERMLAQTLQWLEGDGLVLRIAHDVVPPHVEYRLTPLGRELRASIDFFEHQQDRPVTQAFINGGTSRSELMMQSLQTELLVECKVWNPATSLQLALTPEQTAEAEHVLPQLAVAVGAALAAL